MIDVGLDECRRLTGRHGRDIQRQPSGIGEIKHRLRSVLPSYAIRVEPFDRSRRSGETSGGQAHRPHRGAERARTLIAGASAIRRYCAAWLDPSELVMSVVNTNDVAGEESSMMALPYRLSHPVDVAPRLRGIR